jgi:hypothetical protein
MRSRIVPAHDPLGAVPTGGLRQRLLRDAAAGLMRGQAWESADEPP